jgi:single-strand DNA-binding protein
MQKLMIIGNLGNDAIVRNVGNDTVISFSVAVNKKIVNPDTGEEKEVSTWFSCAYWTDKTKVAQWLKKGKQVYVEGEISAEIYIDKTNDNCIDLRLRAYKIELLGGADKPKE